MNDNQIIVALITLVGVSIAAYFPFRRGRKADDVTEEDAATSQIYTGYGNLFVRLENDNKELRREITELKLEVIELRKIIDMLRGGV